MRHRKWKQQNDRITNTTQWKRESREQKIFSTKWERRSIWCCVCVYHDYYDIIIRITMQWICVRLSVLCFCFIFVDGMLANSLFPLQFHESTIIIIKQLNCKQNILLNAHCATTISHSRLNRTRMAVVNLFELNNFICFFFQTKQITNSSNILLVIIWDVWTTQLQLECTKPANRFHEAELRECWTQQYCSRGISVSTDWKFLRTNFRKVSLEVSFLVRDRIRFAAFQRQSSQSQLLCKHIF